MATYPGGLWAPTTKTDKVDLVQASHVNLMQDEVVAVQTELGADVAGNQTDLVTRLAVMVDTDGTLIGSDAFPGTPAHKQLFYRTDSDTLYVYDGSAWDVVGGAASNVIFAWSGFENYEDNVSGLYYGTSATPSLDAVSEIGYLFFATDDVSYVTFLNFKFKKISTISTVTVHSRLKRSGTGDAMLNVDIGGVSSTVPPSPSEAWGWTTGTAIVDIDVSGLGNGTAYDGIIQLQSSQDGQDVYCSAVTLIGK